jgi:hypothetical protein
VYLGEHSVSGTSFDHNAILLLPDNPSDFANDPLFQATGGKSATLGAQPFGPNVIGLFGGLQFKPNHPGDAQCYLHDFALVRPPHGESDTAFIRALIAAARRYKNDARYDPFPDPFGLTYNSNSFVSGVLEAAGATPPPRPANVPGYDIPLPIPAPSR